MSAALADRPQYRAPSVPAEYLGKARALRNDILKQPAGAGLLAVARRLQARARRGQKLKVPESVQFAEMWRNLVPATGRLALDTRIEGDALYIRELRLVAAKARSGAWAGADEWEDALAINRIRVRSVGGKFSFTYDRLASINLHAVARRFQRGRDCSAAAVLADIRAIGEVPIEAAEAEFEIAVHDGRWVGRMIDVQGYVCDQPDRTGMIRAVRTFLAPA